MTIDDFHPMMLNVGKAVHNADWNWHNVRSPFARIYYVCSGSASVVLPDGTYRLRPGYMYIIPPFTIHSNLCDAPFTHYYIHVYEDSDAGVNGIFDELDFPVEIPALDGDVSLFAKLIETNPTMRLPESDPRSYDNNTTLQHNIMNNLQPTMGQKLELRGIIYQIFSRFLAGSTMKANARDERIRAACKYIFANLNSRISIDDLADKACLSPDYFTRLFRQTMNHTPAQYINIKRIEKAQIRLLTENVSVKKLAYSLGYEDPPYFIRVFENLTGMTPHEYRNMNIEY